MENANRNADMQAIFNELSEANKDIMLLVARSVKVAQEAGKAAKEAPAAGCPAPNGRERRMS